MAKSTKTTSSAEVIEEVSVPVATETVIDVVVSAPVKAPEMDEVKFLKKLYAIQNEGKFGTHLNQFINDRIAYLQNKK
jgi:hypothetical protein